MTLAFFGGRTMEFQSPPKSQEICRKLFSGYQFSDSDIGIPDIEDLYRILEDNFSWFKEYLKLSGFVLQNDESVFFLEKENKELSNEEKQTIVVLYLLTDLWMEKGKIYGDLFQLKIPWQEFDWFRDGYGKEYLAQVKIETKESIEELFKRIDGKGLITYSSDTCTLTFRKPADRIVKLAIKVYKQINTEEQ